MGEEVVKARLINREDADLLKLNFPKMRWAACSINGRRQRISPMRFVRSGIEETISTDVTA
jgi:hypothetical protein